MEMPGSGEKKAVTLAITGALAIMQVLQAYPQVRQVFSLNGMACLECMGAASDTIAAGACIHGVNLERLISDLNKAIAYQD
jgi:hybrid cluster-associated redox disulfide protein